MYVCMCVGLKLLVYEALSYLQLKQVNTALSESVVNRAAAAAAAGMLKASHTSSLRAHTLVA